MPKIRYSFYLILFLQVGSWQKLKAQQHNAYQFIEPNIAISYDSNYFKAANRYSNSFYKTEAYDFTLKNDNNSATRIHIKPELNDASHITESMLDSFLRTQVKEFKKLKSKNYLILTCDTIPIKINGFTCLGSIVSDKNKKHFVASISCTHISQNDLTEVTYTSLGDTSLKKDYSILEKFLSGFVSYRPQQIATHDSLVKADFKITLTQTQKQRIDTTVSVEGGITHYFIKKYDYEAIVKVTSPSISAYKVKEVRVKISSNGFRFFTPLQNEDVLISYNDPKKGMVSGSGEVVLANTLDKDVIIPFTFSYSNE
jgi:hypothetical protein